MNGYVLDMCYNDKILWLEEVACKVCIKLVNVVIKAKVTCFFFVDLWLYCKQVHHQP